AAMGLSLQNVYGQAQLRGQGAKGGPYDGHIELAHADFQSKPLKLTLQDLEGDARFKGRLAAGKPPAMPDINGWLETRNGQYTHADTGLTVTKLQGRVVFRPQEFEVPNLRGYLGSAPLSASGDFSPDFRRYQVHVTGQGINIPRLKREVLAKLPG